jgi:deoxyribose-phosphate aldolase
VVTRVREFAKTLDHTLLRPEASEADVRRLCREAAYYHFAAVCVLLATLGLLQGSYEGRM